MRQAIVAGFAFVLVASCALLPAGPTQIKVSHETFPWADPSQYRTYAWWRPAPTPRQGLSEREQLIDFYVRNAVDRELATRGYVQHTTGTPGFVVHYTVRLQQQSTESFSDYLQYRAEGGGKDMGQSFMGYDVGTLTLTMTDPATGRLVWRGIASAVIESDARGKRIDPAVQKMMAQFPRCAAITS